MAAETTTYDPATRSAIGGAYPVYKTVNAAIAGVETGGTINVRAGTYKELARANTCYPVEKSMTIQAYNGEAVTLTYPDGNPPLYAGGPDYGFVVQINIGTVTLDGLTFVGMLDEGNQDGGYDYIVSIGQTGQGTIKNCTFQKAGHASIKYGVTGGPVTIEKNIFSDCGHSYLDHHIYIDSGNDGTYKTTIRHNAFTDVAGYAIHLYVAPDNCEIYGNVIHHCGTQGGSGGGIVLGGTGHKVYNNTIVDNYGMGGLLIWSDYSINNEIKNNIIRGNATVDLDVALANPGPNAGATNNIDTINLHGGAGYSSSDDVDVDPQFAEATPDTWDDYRLDALSPMIDAGTDVGAGYVAILDPEQTTRPAPKDQGASRDIGAFTT